MRDMSKKCKAMVILLMMVISGLVAGNISYNIGLNNSVIIDVDNIGELLPEENETLILFKEGNKYYAIHRYDYNAYSEWKAHQKELWYQDENGHIIVNSTLYVGSLCSPTTIDNNTLNHFHWDHYFGGLFGKTFIGRGDGI